MRHSTRHSISFSFLPVSDFYNLPVQIADTSHSAGAVSLQKLKRVNYNSNDKTELNFNHLLTINICWSFFNTRVIITDVSDSQFDENLHLFIKLSTPLEVFLHPGSDNDTQQPLTQ